MIDFRHSEYQYWKLFNRIAKVTGYFFLFGGIFGFVILSIYAFDPSLFPETEQSPEHLRSFDAFKFVSIAMFLVVAALGLLLTKVKPYFPSHLQQSNTSKTES